MRMTTLTTSHWRSAWRGMSWLNLGESLPTFSRATIAGNRVLSFARRTSSIRLLSPPNIQLCCIWGSFWYSAKTVFTLSWTVVCCVCAGCHAVCVRIQGHRAGGGAFVLVSAREQERMFCRLPVFLLWPAAPWCGVGDCLEAQHHGFLNAIFYSGHEGVPQQGGSAIEVELSKLSSKIKTIGSVCFYSLMLKLWSYWPLRPFSVHFFGSLSCR